MTHVLKRLCGTEAAGLNGPRALRYEAVGVWEGASRRGVDLGHGGLAFWVVGWDGAWRVVVRVWCEGRRLGMWCRWGFRMERDRVGGVT